MRKIKEALRLKGLGLSNRQIATSIKAARSTVAEYLRVAAEAGVAWPFPPELDDSALEKMLFPALDLSEKKGKPKPDLYHVHKELKKKSVTLQLLWEEYLIDYPQGYRYTQFCRLYRSWRECADPSMRQNHKAGEKMFVDYAGQTVPIVCPGTGETRQAQIFVGVLGASNHTFAEATASQELSSWIGSHTRAFNFFGGVPRIIVPDNLKTGVTKACYYEPDINRTYLDMADHYGAAIIPARIVKPKDKAKVEVGVQIVERFILARLRNCTFFSLTQLNLVIKGLVKELNNKPFKKLEGTRRSLFEEIDKPALLALPGRPYEYAVFKKVTVNIDYHIEVLGHYYSVPYQLIKQTLDARITQRVVEVFFKGKRIASHIRSAARGAHSTSGEHMPSSHKAYLEWTPSRIIAWAETTGPGVASLTKAIMASRKHPEWGFRSCLGLIRLSRSYSAERLEAAAARALEAGALSYKSVKRILESKLDQAPITREHIDVPRVEHENIRGKDYYN